jgi:hypothetical protein
MAANSPILRSWIVESKCFHRGPLRGSVTADRVGHFGDTKAAREPGSLPIPSEPAERILPWIEARHLGDQGYFEEMPSHSMTDRASASPTSTFLGLSGPMATGMTAARWTGRSAGMKSSIVKTAAWYAGRNLRTNATSRDSESTCRYGIASSNARFLRSETSAARGAADRERRRVVLSVEERGIALDRPDIRFFILSRAIPPDCLAVTRKKSCSPLIARQPATMRDRA